MPADAPAGGAAATPKAVPGGDAETTKADPGGDVAAPVVAPVGSSLRGAVPVNSPRLHLPR